MKNNKCLHALVFAGSVVVLGALCEPALGHPGHSVDSFVAGVLHPLGGLDHLLAMVTVGLLASRMEPRRMWVLPLTFVVTMAGGGFLGLIWPGKALGAIEWGIGLSVVVFAAIVAIATEVPMPSSGLVVATCAVCHGYAHTVEMSGSSVWGYFLGMLASTYLLHAAGLGVGVLMKKGLGDWSIRLSGAMVAIGFALVVIVSPS